MVRRLREMRTSLVSVLAADPGDDLPVASTPATAGGPLRHRHDLCSRRTHFRTGLAPGSSPFYLASARVILVYYALANQSMSGAI